VVPNWLSEQTPIWVYNGNRRIAEYGVHTNQAGLDFGVQGRYGEGRIGIFAGKRTSFPRTGSITAPESHDNYYGGQLTLVADQLDATDFPRDGYVLGASFRAEQVDSDLGGNFSNHRAELYGKQVVSFGDHTFAASIRVGEGSNKISLNQAFSLGGFMNLSGLQLNQILGTSLRYGSLSYQNQLYTLPDPLGRGIYGGFALEGGKMDGLSIGLQQPGWIYGATAFIGAHTAIGPVYLGYGYAQGNNRLFYLFLGRPGL
jgi:NTE family protein